MGGGDKQQMNCSEDRWWYVNKVTELAEKEMTLHDPDRGEMIALMDLRKLWKRERVKGQK